MNPQSEAKFTKRIVRNPNGTIDEVLEAPGKPKIIIHKRPRVKIFREPVKCPVKGCNVYFATDFGISPSMLGGNPNIHKHHEKRNREKRNEIPIAS